MLRSHNYRTVLKQIGSLFIVQGVIIIIPSFISMIYAEWYSSAGFFLSALFSTGIGVFFYRFFEDAEDIHYNNALVVAASGWLGITLMGGLPFYIIAHITPEQVLSQLIPNGAGYSFSSIIYFKHPLHCFFESMSAYTTTGLTMAVHEPSVGKGVLFYRSLAQWVGGAGFIVMVLAVFKQPSGREAMALFSSESSAEKLKPKIIQTARAIWKVYMLITIISTVYLIIGTLLILPDYPLRENIFDSINHAMAGQSTGGFSTLDDSIASYNSPFMEMLYLLPMILGSFSITFYYKVIYEKRFKELWQDIQTRSLIIAFFVGSAILSFLLFHANIVPNPIREGIFQFISAMSTTGWQTSNIGCWDWLSIVFVVSAAMFIGGASGATVGGIKMIRALFIQKSLRWQINKIFLSRNAVKSFRFDGKSMLPEEINEEFAKAASLAILFFLIILISSVITAIYTNGNFSFADALFEATSAQSTVGLSSGITDPSMPPVIELVLIFQMWAGRLEIMPVLALIRALFWGTGSRII